jgi:hypothetical protein
METSTARPSSLYRPLNSERFEIRLLKVTSSPESEMIECDLKVFELDSQLVYMALSYAWV